MDKQSAVKALRVEMEAFFDRNTFKGDYDGIISAKMECDFDLPEGWSATVHVSARGYEHKDKGDYLNPPSTSCVYWVDAELVTLYDSDGAFVCELRHEKELTLKIEY